MTSTRGTLRLTDVSVGYAGVPVLHDIDISMEAGEVVAILGANGTGKTTLLHTIAGVIPPVGGDIRLGGAPLHGPVHRRARRGVALVTEERAIIRGLTVRENLRLGTRNPGEALRLFPYLRPFLRRKAGLLSGGEQQMLVLARVLANRPQVLLVDELSFGLAPRVVQHLLRVLRDAADRGAAVLVVEQHPAQALSVADRGYVLNRGRIELTGTSEELLARHDHIERAYLAVARDATV
jgi:branched-chain amino acid transport system ATP-binding protein